MININHNLNLLIDFYFNTLEDKMYVLILIIIL